MNSFEKKKKKERGKKKGGGGNWATDLSTDFLALWRWEYWRFHENLSQLQITSLKGYASQVALGFRGSAMHKPVKSLIE